MLGRPNRLDPDVYGDDTINEAIKDGKDSGAGSSLQ
jgi:hypothetical protein